ncbi:GNAT family N-acetyltransferase [Mangrovibacillus cuniculi]|uniref:GNAT family N-acetyltransferase n=1 Tax=Mangrovibacillus cuniculi TaxID=2593652 RepID=A0A7S8HES3_9BACI|nr:GNAT family N-acetyltransferase [Mangrovibacillus cuniculi]QPC45680.1 GNAT family N-acetyltransferase [Mangrovibacillus cuniculi]
MHTTKKLGNFFEKVVPKLQENEALHNLAFGILKREVTNEHSTLQHWYLESDGEVVGLLMRTPPHKFIAICFDHHQVELVGEWILDTVAASDSNGGFVVEETLGNFLKTAWPKRFDSELFINVGQGVYECLDVATPKVDGGTFHLLGHAEKDWLVKAYMAFVVETSIGESTHEEAVQTIEKMFTYATFWGLRVDGELVAMCANSRSTDNVGVINFVYTPKEFRKRGYGSAITAYGTQQMINKFGAAALYTDLSNPTSNSIYQEIGYKRIGTSLELKVRGV